MVDVGRELQSTVVVVSVVSLVLRSTVAAK
jgi:hypothetical protein